jgi:hypothetical protein
MGNNMPHRTRAAMSAGGADALVRWDFCRLDFFVSFLIKQKRNKQFAFPQILISSFPHFEDL